MGLLLVAACTRRLGRLKMVSNWHSTPTQPILPVVFGGDAGAYALGLECYEAFGVRCLCVANEPVALIKESVFFDIQHIEPGASDEQRLASLTEVAEANGDKHLILLANSDGAIGFFARHRHVLEEHYLIPSPTDAVIDALTSETLRSLIDELSTTNDERSTLFLFGYVFQNRTENRGLARTSRHF